ncbi:MAG: MBL fold metallo-hydrolase [Deltaproteobacteria bacterium]|nr:MBL fold metallo-hydrolase [Deltaproteobacteria bacterium]MBI3039543.1 MBL fold metallo-hydrolase [bacterium]
MKETLKKGLFLVLFAVFLFSDFLSFAEGKPLLRVTFLNIGQGDAALVRSDEKTVLIDSGDDRANSSKGVIIPYCKKNGIEKIDTCVISHPHRDHFGGFLELIQEIPVGEFL